MTRHRGERGAATAELAMVLPLLVAVTAGLTWLLVVGAAQVRAVDAARETARAVARGDTVDAAVARGEHVAPAGSAVRVDVTGSDVRVVVTGEISGPGGLFEAIPGARVEAEAVGVLEGPVDGGAP
jgi:Flp pilus assembly protein TadG